MPNSIIPINHSRRQFVRIVGSTVLGAWQSRSCTFGQSPRARETKNDLLTPAAQKAIDQGLAFLTSRQNEEGSFGNGSYARNVAVCGLVGMSFLAQGSTPERGKHALVVGRCLDFLLKNCAESGLVHTGEQGGREPMYGHGFATLFLAEAYGTTSREDLRDKLTRAIQLIINSQNSEGGWRYEPRRYEADVSVTVCQVLALRAARNAGLFVPNDSVERAVSYLKRAQNADGGFMYMLNHPGESSFPRSAAAVVALMSAGLYDSDEVRRGLEYLQKNAPPLKSLVGHSYFLYGQYYAAQGMWQAGGESWIRWYSDLRNFLVGNQEKNGSWYEAISPEYSTAMACLILQMPNNYLPIFQR